MRSWDSTSRPAALLLGVVIVVAAVASLPAQEESGADAAPHEGRLQKSSQENLFQVPDGSAERLLEYIENLPSEPAAELAGEKVREFQHKRQEAILKAAEKVMAANPTDEQLERAADEKMTALDGLARHDEKYEKRLQDFPRELAKAGHARLARDVKASLLRRDFLQLREPNRDDLVKFIDRVQEFLAEGEMDAAGIRLAINVARAIESTGDRKLAARAYRELGKVLAKSDEEGIVDLGQKMQGSARRLDLVGNTMQLEGIRVNGDPLDWSEYRGRVTLVMFWATWCGPCRREITQVQEIYKQYHERGFDVVGISVDEDREELKEFLNEQDIPWAIIYDQARADGKKGETMAVRYGVMAIPETILVDRQGKVVTTEIRGSQLEEQLKEMIGPAGEEKAGEG